MAVPPPDRGLDRPGRPGQNLARTFRPNYLGLCPTYQCNLTCPHCCVPIEWPDRLEVAAALRFLEQARAEGVEVLGFSGGEPFLYPGFVVALTRRGAELGYRFDKVQTNGVWHQGAAELGGVLGELAGAGFTGKLGLSVDKFHGAHTAKAVEFCRVARRVFGRDIAHRKSKAPEALRKGPGRRLALCASVW